MSADHGYINAQLRDAMDRDPKWAMDAITDYVRVVLLEESHIRGQIGVPSVLGEGDLFCTVEGKVPVYRSDFDGDGDSRPAIRQRAIDTIPPEHRTPP